MDDEDWLRREYASAYRTACLLLLDPQDAAEVVQSAFLRMWTFRDALPADATRRGWLYRVVVRACTTGPPAHRTTRGQHTELLAALTDLPEDLRVALVLRYAAGLSDEEIAVAVRRRPAAVKKLLDEARQRLALEPRLAPEGADPDPDLEATR